MLNVLLLTAALGAHCDDGVCPVATIVAAPVRVVLAVQPVRSVLRAQPARRVAAAVVRAKPARRVVGRVANRVHERPRLRAARRVVLGR